MSVVNLPKKQLFDDLEFLASYFCRPGEIAICPCIESLNLIDNETISFSIRLNFFSDEAGHCLVVSICAVYKIISTESICATVTLAALPEVSISSSSIKGNVILALKDDICKNGLYAIDTTTFSLVDWILYVQCASLKCIESFEEPKKNEVLSNDSFQPLTNELVPLKEDGLTMASLAQLHHIRSKSRYSKFFQSISSELMLEIHLYTHKKDIYFVVLGSQCTIKEYFKRHKTENVDIDSSGKPRKNECTFYSLLCLILT